MNNLKQLVILLFIILHKSTFSQCESFVLSGRVVDTTSNQSFYNLMIINKKNNIGIFGKPDGSFTLKIKNTDTLYFSTEGYHLFKFTPGITETCQSVEIFYLKSKSKKLNEVVITPLKSIQTIKEERENLTKIQSKNLTGVNIIQSPITALYERFSKRAKSIEKVNNLKYEDQKKQILKELLSIYVVYEILDLNISEFDDFINFLNIDDRTLKKLNDIELVTFIKDKYKHFMQYKTNLKNSND
jgi:hypothetical protein